MDEFQPHLAELIASGREFIICGDWNIAHKEIDLKLEEQSEFPGFTGRTGVDGEFVRRSRLGRCVSSITSRDNQQKTYTWSNRGQAWANNVGWWIDYHVATPHLKGKTKIGKDIYKRAAL